MAKFNYGDKVIYLGGGPRKFKDTKIGKIYELSECPFGPIPIYFDEAGDSVSVDPHQENYFRKIEEASELTTKFNVGDVVVTLDKVGYAKLGQGVMLAGAIGKVKAVEGDKLTVKFNKKQPFNCEDTKKYRKNFVVRTSEVRLATAEEAATIAKKKKRLTVGDYAEVIANESGHKAVIGDVVKIVTDEHDDHPYECVRVSDGKDVWWFYESELKRADKPSQSDEVITFEGEQYRKVDRKAQAGDVVVFRENTYSGLTNGVPYLVKQGRTSLCVEQHTLLYHPDYGRTPETVDVYEKFEAEQSSYVPQEGDIVVVTANTNDSRNAVGDVGKVGTVSLTGLKGAWVDVPGKTSGNGNYTKLEEMRKATPAEVEAYEKAVADASKPKLKAGDFVKFTSNHLMSAVTLGEVYELKANKHGRLYVDTPNGECTAVNRKGTVFGAPELVTADEAKWSKIGRKPGEFKKGDIVRGERNLASGEFVVGVVEVVDKKPGSVGITTFNTDKFRSITVTELIAPVESVLA